MMVVSTELIYFSYFASFEIHHGHFFSHCLITTLDFLEDDDEEGDDDEEEGEFIDYIPQIWLTMD